MSSFPINNAILHGGPAHLPDHDRVRRVADTDATVKLRIGNGYEHFEPTPETVERDGYRLRVFRWTQRTYIAE